MAARAPGAVAAVQDRRMGVDCHDQPNRQTDIRARGRVAFVPQMKGQQAEQTEHQKRVRARCMSQQRDFASAPRSPAGDDESVPHGSILSAFRAPLLPAE